MRTKPTITIAITIVLMFLLSSAVQAAGQEYSRDDLVFLPQVFEYGSIGIDYSVHHDFHLINQGKKPVRILDTEIDCDCTTLRLSDSVAAPGDTIVLKTTLKTSNLYGPTGKSVIVVTDHPLLERIEYRFPAEIGQWSQGFKPLPLGLMFLPGAKPQEVRIWNRHFPRATMQIANQYDRTFTVELVNASVARGEMLTLNVLPNNDIPPGTYTSNFTLSILPEGRDTPVHLTIPVKTVRY